MKAMFDVDDHSLIYWGIEGPYGEVYQKAVAKSLKNWVPICATSVEDPKIVRMTLDAFGDDIVYECTLEEFVFQADHDDFEVIANELERIASKLRQTTTTKKKKE